MNRTGRRARFALLVVAIAAAVVVVGAAIAWGLLQSVGIRVGYPAVLVGIVVVLGVVIAQSRTRPARRGPDQPMRPRRPAQRPTFMDVETLRRLERSGHVSHDQVQRLAEDLVEGLADAEPDDDIQMPIRGRH